MTGSDVKAAVDAAIRQHLDTRGSGPTMDVTRPVAGIPQDDPAHGRFLRAALPGDPPAGRCVIEPSVECTGCGYCRSRGH